MGQNSVEFQVSLGLQAAYSQIEKMRDELQKSVKIDSSAFKDIERFLNKIAGQVDTLKSKMNTAFSNSTSSKQYLKQYEQLIGMLQAVQNQFSSLGINDLILSADDQKTLDSTTEKIAELSKEINALQNGKVGNFFQNDQIEDIEKIRKAFSDFHIEAENLTFNKLTSELKKAMSEVDGELTKAKTQITSLQGQIDTLSVNKIQGVTDQIKEAFNNATTGHTFKTDTTQYNELLKQFYSEFDGYQGKKTTTVKAGSSIEDMINKEVTAITTGIENMRQRRQEYENMRDEMLAAFRETPGSSAITAIQEIAEKYNFDIDDTFLSKNWTSYWKGVKKQIAAAMEKEGLLSDEVLDKMQQDMLAKLQTLFKNADVTNVIDITAFRKQVGDILKNLNLDLSSADIGTITNSIVKGFDLSSILTQTDNMLTQYRGKIEQVKQEAETARASLQESSENLNAAMNIASTTNVNTDAIQDLQSQLNDLRQIIEDLINKYNQLAGTNITFDTKSLEQGRQAAEGATQSLQKLEQRQKSLGNIQMAVNRWMGFWQVLNMTKSAIQDMKSHVEELDQVMTKIAVVTNMSQDDLWNQISSYSQIATQYGVAIKGVYEVSQIYYQQGLQSNDVMTLTTETLKMARIAGLDYATAADYMTSAIRGFKLEMSDAAHVTDVFSALAATTASSTEEIAVAISKTAASAANVGASFEATSAMMATMIATTRESATNIGTALKSIISRYGEMTSNPNATKDSEGEEMSLNRVDAALKTVGITLQTTAGQFRDFDDVMLELAEKWDTIDTNTQRYIATIMAGNRQQSRFLALISNVDEYKKALATATNSEGAGELQTLKTLDSIDAKIEKMKVTIQEFYTSSGIQDLYKGILDTITNVVSAANSLPKIFGNIPGLAIALGAQLVSTIKSVLQLIIASISTGLESIKGNTENVLLGLVSKFRETGVRGGQELVNGVQQGTQNLGTAIGGQLGTLIARYAGAAMQLVGSGITIQGMSQYGASTSEKEDVAAGRATLSGSLLSAGGAALSSGVAGFAMGGPAGAVVGILSGIATNLPSILTSLDMLNPSLDRIIELDEKAQQKAEEEVTRAKGEEYSLEKAAQQLKELEEAQYDSAEASQKYIDYMNQLKDTYPELVSSINQLGDATITTTDLEEKLALARQKTASASINAIEAEIKTEQDKLTAYEQLVNGANVSQYYNPTEMEQFLYNLGPSGNPHLYATNNWAEGKGNIYQQMINYAMKNQMTSGREWWDYFGQPFSIDTVTPEQAQEWMEIHPELEDTFVRRMLTDENNNNRKSSEQLGTLRSGVHDLLEDIPDSLDLSLSEITEITDFKLEDLNDMDTDQLIKILDNIKKHASDYIKSTETTLKTYEETLNRAKTDRDITTYINNLSGRETTFSDKADILTKYASLMGFILDAKFDGYEDINANENIGGTDELAEWLIQYSDLAERLLNVDYSQYRNIDDFYKDFEGLKDSAADNGWQTAFYNARQILIDGTNKQIEKVFGAQSKQFKLLLDNDGEAELNTNVISLLRSGISEYSTLLAHGQTVMAQNYLSGLSATFDAVGLLDSDQQNKMFDVLKNVDLSDRDSLQTAIDALTELGPEYDNVIKALTDAQERIVINVQAQALQVLEGLSDYASSIQKIVDNIGKEISYADALKTAIELVNKDSSLNIKDLITETDTGKWTLTSEGIKQSLAQAKKTQENNLVVLKENAEQQIEWYETIINSNANGGVSAAMQALGSSGVSGTELQAAQVQIDQLYTDYLEWIKQEENIGKSFTDYISIQKEEVQKILDEAIALGENIDQTTAASYLKSYDYKNVLTGKYTSRLNQQDILKTTIESAVENFDEQEFDVAFAELFNGNFEKWNQYLSEIGLGNMTISSTDQQTILRAQYEEYQQALIELTSGKAYSQMSEITKELTGITEDTDLSDTTQLQLAAERLLQAIQNYYINGIITFTEWQESLSSTLIKQNENAKYGKQKKLLDSMKDGFSAKELEEVGALVQENGQVTLKGAWSNLLEIDTTTGDYKVKAEAAANGIEWVVQELAKAYGIAIDKTSKGYRDAISSGVDQRITELNASNIGKQGTEALSKISNAKTGDLINISGTSKLFKQTLRMHGFNVSEDGILSIGTEQELNDAILSLEDLLNSSVLEPVVKDSIQTMIDSLKSKMNKNTGLSGIIGESVSQSSAQSFALAFDHTTKNVKSLMEDMGFTWDELTQTYIASSDSITKINNKIAELETEPEANKEAINNLKAAAANLERSLDQKKNDSIATVLTNYANVSEEAIAAFNTAFDGLDLNDYLTTDEFGIKSLDISKLEELKTLLQTYGIDVDALFSSQLFTIADAYMSDVISATSIITSGTTNAADLDKILEAYQKQVNDKATYEDIFSYSDLLDGWVLKPAEYKRLIEAQAKSLADAGILKPKDVEKWITDNTNKKMAENVDISSFLSSDDLFGKSAETLQAAMSTYLQTIALDTSKYDEFLEQGYMKAIDWEMTPQEVADILWEEYYESTVQTVEEEVANDIETLRNGGKDAVEVLAKWAEKNETTLSTDDIEKAYKLQFNKLSNAMSALDEIEVGDVVSKEVASVLNQISGFKIDENGIVEAVGDLVQAYKNIYFKIKFNATSTTNDINKAYAKLLTAQSRDNVNALDTLENAAGMTYEAFGDMLSQYGIYLEDALADAKNFGIQDTGFGKIRVTDFNALASHMGWDINSPEYAEAYSKWVDSMAELVNQPATFMQSAADQLKGLVDAKPNQAINVSYLDKQLNGTLEDIVTNYGAQLHNGLLTITETTDLPALIQAISQQAAATGAMIPEQLAEVADAVEGLLDQIISLIKSGISGSMSNVDAVNLSKWANDNGIGAIQFTETNEGLKITQESLATIYNQLKQIDGIQAQGLLPEIQKSTNSYDSFNKVLAEYYEAQRQINYNNESIDLALKVDYDEARNKAFELYEDWKNDSNVQMEYYLRPHLVDDEGYVETFLSTAGKASNAETTVLVTPILPDGTKLDTNAAEKLASQLADKEITLDTTIQIDGKDTEYTLRDIYMGTYDTVEAANEAAAAYHNFHDAVASNYDISSLNSLNEGLKNTQSMLADILSTMMTSPDSFNFMSEALPDAMQSVKNVYENAYSAIDTIKSAKSSGYMDLQDFYNIVTTAANYMELAGKEFNIKGMNAAQLIEAAGEKLVTVDGTLSVDLSSSGLNIQGSLDDLSDNLKTGINGLADAEVEILDSEIAVMEVLAAMEEIGDVDVDNNGISFEIGDIFDETTLTGFTSKFDKFKTKILEMASDSEGLETALQNWKINGTSMADLLKAGASEWIAAFGSESNVSKLLQTLTSTDWDLDNIQSQIQQIMSTFNIPMSFDSETGFITFSATGKVFNFDLSDSVTEKEVSDALTDALKTQPQIKGENVKETLRNAWELYNDKSTWETLTWEEQSSILIAMGLASGEINIQEQKDKTWKGTYNGTTFTGKTKEAVEQSIAQAMEAESEGYTFKTTEKGAKLETTKQIGEQQINLKWKNGKKYYYVGNRRFDSEQAALAYLASQGEASKDQAGHTYNFTDNYGDQHQYTIRYNEEIGEAYVYDEITGEYIYHNQHFSSYEAMCNFIIFEKQRAGLSGYDYEITDNKKQRIVKYGQAQMIYDYETGKTTYRAANGAEFSSYQAFADYLYALESNKANADVVGEYKIPTEGSDETVPFIYEGKKVLLTVDTNGESQYDVQMEGGHFIAHSLADIKTGLAAYGAIYASQVQGGKVNGTENPSGTSTGSGRTIDFEFDSGDKFQLTITNGKVEVTDEEGNIDEGLTEGVDKVLENTETEPIETDEPINVKASAVNIILGENPNVNFTGGANGEGAEEAVSTEGLTVPAISATTNQLNISLAPGANVNIDTKGAEEGADAGDTSIDIPVIPTKDANFDNQVTQLEEVVEETNPKMEVEGETTEASEKGSELKTEIEGLDPLVTIKISDNASSLISNIKSDLAEMSSKTYKIQIQGNVTTAKGYLAKGNVALAAGNQKTLMGELGPELVVSNGRYFVVGQSGAEMVDLPKDAIVFNHQQTASLLANGHSGRGKAVTNETNAVSFAKGNTQGPAMASASAALATLKQLKAMWESLQDASVQDLAGKGGSGGGGGSGDSSSSDRKSWIEDVERWYNLMQKIAQLETDITQQETLRTKLNSDFKKNGKAYYESQKASLDMIDQQLIAQNELNISRQAYFAKRQGQLNKEGAFKDLYEFDENGQLKYKDFKKAKKVSFTDSDGNKISNTYKNGFEFLSDLTAVDDNGKAKYTVEQQYELLKAMGYENQMKYDSSGNEITKEYDDDGNEKEDQSTFYTNSVQAVWDLIESQKTEMQDLHDTIEDGQNKMNELMDDRNEILKEIRDNQMSVEQDVLNAIVDSRQRQIDDLQDQRDALEDSTSKYIQGLTDQLNAERQMYENQESQNDLDTKRRKLAVLQRSGGSSSEIASLQDEIRSAEQDMYFDKFQEQIDAIQAASDKEIERLDAQIDLMTETLEYQKENGLLWDQVYEIMNGKSGAGIAQFIMDQNSEYWGNSPLKKSEDLQGLLFKSEQWTAFRDDQKLNNKETKQALADNKITTSDIHSAVYGTDSDTEWKMMNKSMTDLYGPNWNKTAKNIGEKFEKQYATSGDITAAANAVIENKKIQKQIGEKTTGKKNSNNGKKSEGTKISGGNGDKNSQGASTSETYQSIKVKGDYVIFTDENGKVTKKPKSKITDEEKKMYNLKFSKGGLARFTGLAQLDGTPTEPEAVLTQAQTAVLRNDILGNSRNSLLNLLVDFRSVVSGMNSAAAYTGTSNDNSVAIQNASVNMYVDSIDNNYGAQQAGDKVMDEILRIARKSGANNSVGR